MIEFLQFLTTLVLLNLGFHCLVLLWSIVFNEDYKYSMIQVTAGTVIFIFAKLIIGGVI